ncbi:MAG: hypothetical protein AAFV80_16595, partial [Bacteroidota bacterium]
MKEGKFIALLQTFSAAEQREFGKFLDVEVFNKKEHLRILYQLVSRQGKKKPFEPLDKFQLFQQVYQQAIQQGELQVPNPAKAKKVIANQMHELKRLLEDFLILKKARTDSSFRDQSLLSCLESEKTNHLFLPEVERISKNQEKLSFRDMNYYLRRFERSHLTYFHPATAKIGHELQALSDSTSNLDLFICASKLRYAVILLNRQRVYSEHYEPAFLKDAIEFAKGLYLYIHPALRIYLVFIDILDDTKWQLNRYERLKASFFEHLHSFRRKEQIDIFIWLRNYCIFYFNKGVDGIANELFELYQTGLEQQLLLQEDGRLLYRDYLNIIALACSLKSFDWVEQFIESHTKELSRDQQLDGEAIGKATLNFHKQDFQGALDMLNQRSTFNSNYDKLIEKSLR